MRAIRLDQWLESRAPGAVMAPLRILERMESGGVAWLGNRRLLARGYLLVSRQDLWRRVEPEELGVPPTRLLPDLVLLLLKPTDEETKLLESPYLQKPVQNPGIISEEQERLERQRGESLGKLTRRLVMARLEQALVERNWNLERAEEFAGLIPSCELDEIRQVLARDGRCRADASLDKILLEFLPWFGMLSALEPDRMEAFFPGLAPQTCKSLEALLESRTRLGAIVADSLDRDHPIQSSAQLAEEEPDPYLEHHRRLAEEAESQGQWVTAALEQVRESRLCVGKRSENAHARARFNLRQLVEALKEPLGLDVDGVEGLTKALDPVLEKADQGESREEAVFLRQLQGMQDGLANKAYALDLVEYAVSLGVRPWKRQLHYLGLVQVSGRLKILLGLLPVIRVSDQNRAALQRVLGASALHAETQVRRLFHPLIDSALDDVGLVATNPLERVARRKIIQELIDRILDQGHITFYDLRDALSRNHLKMRDIHDPAEWLQGDPLLRLDRRLAAPLDGIYRPCPIYSRMLERVTSLGFGTHWGRWLVGKVIVPYGLAALMVVVFHTLAEHIGPAAKSDLVAAGDAAQTVLETVRDGSPETLAESATKAAQSIHAKPPPSVVTPVNLLTIAILGSVILLFSSHPGLRRMVGRGMANLGEGLHWLVHDLPQILPRHPLFLYGVYWPLVVLWHAVLKPLAVVLIIFWLSGLEIHWNSPIFFSAWLVAALALVSRQARLAEEWFADVLRDILLALRSGVLMRALGVLNELFRMVTRWFDQQLASVENLLRVRQRDGAGRLSGRAFLSLLWFPVGWTGRFIFVVLIEPMLHPLKLPICFLAAKVIYPVLYPLTTDVAVPALTPMMGALASNLFMGVVVFLLPNAFGFFFWEFRENRGLYDANRPERPAPDSAGDHGETMAVLLEPGLHGGVLPALFSKLRHASLPPTEGGSRTAQRACERRLELLREALGRFFRRNFLDVLGVTQAWGKGEQVELIPKGPVLLPLAQAEDVPVVTRQWCRPLELESVSLAVNRVEATFKPAPGFGLEALSTTGENRLRLYFAYMEDHLQAWLDRPDWLETLDEKKRHALAWSIAWIYRAAGVEIAREPLELLAPPGGEQPRLQGERVVFALPQGEKVVYQLTDRGRAWRRIASPGDQAVSGPIPSEVRPAWRALFGEMPFSWDLFVDRWSEDAKGGDFGQVRLEDFWIDLLGETRAGMGANSIRLVGQDKIMGA